MWCEASIVEVVVKSQLLSSASMISIRSLESFRCRVVVVVGVHFRRRTEWLRARTEALVVPLLKHLLPRTPPTLVLRASSAGQMLLRPIRGQH